MDYFQLFLGSLQVVLYYFVAPPSGTSEDCFVFVLDIHYRDLCDKLNRKRGPQKLTHGATYNIQDTVPGII